MPTIGNVASLDELPGLRTALPSPGSASAGEIAQHSDDSVSLLLDDGSVFSGDLTLPAVTTEDAAAVVR